MDLNEFYEGDEEKIKAFQNAKSEATLNGLKDGALDVIDGMLHPIDSAVDLATAAWNYDKTYDAIKVSVNEWNELYSYALEYDPALAGEMSGYLQGNILGNVSTGMVASGVTAKLVQKAIQLRNTKVTVELDVDGYKFKDTNQNARPKGDADPKEPTLINDRVTDKELSTGKPKPNGNMATAHGEIGAIQQAHNMGLAKGKDLNLKVTGKDVCDYCKGDIAAAAKASGANSVTIQAFDNKTGLPKTYIWKPGMKSIKEVK